MVFEHHDSVLVMDRASNYPSGTDYIVLARACSCHASTRCSRRVHH